MDDIIRQTNKHKVMKRWINACEALEVDYTLSTKSLTVSNLLGSSWEEDGWELRIHVKNEGGPQKEANNE